MRGTAAPGSGTVDLELTPEQREFSETVEKFALRELNDDLVGRDRDGVFAEKNWRKCAATGLLGLPVPAEYGGQDADATTTTAALEALGYGCRDNGLLFSLHAHLWAGVSPIVRFGSAGQKERYLPAMCAGESIAGHAMSEPGSGSDAFALTTSVTRRGGNYVLNGSKTFVSNAPIADVLLVFAVEERRRGFAGVSAFLVDRDTPGLTVSKPLSKMGLRTSPMGDVRLDDCEIPAACLLGPEGAGMAVFTWTMERERSFILATALGTMRRDLERCVEHARTRHQFGQPIGSFQAVSHRIVDMRMRLDVSRLLLRRLARLTDRGEPTAVEAALAKVYVSEAFVQSGLDAIQIHGGYGYSTEYEVERDLRDALASRIYSGTSEIQRDLAARHMGLSARTFGKEQRKSE
ncbi:acyl-CoA dehydrogenase family protein [Streptomyces sp. NPDC050548]|uniref:acyl-CoA dehydrogenase family protein n=1 Tax=Streptomyces sp. NPDC050548 TaxID=3365629 RepID=UPI0037995A78